MTEVEQRQRPDDTLEARRIMKFMTLGLGALWTLDGLLQLQPQMFTRNFAAQVIGLGGILTGLGTDPNTPPVIALLMVPAIAWRKYSKK